MDEYGFEVDVMESADLAGERAWRRARGANRATGITGPHHDPEHGPVRWRRGSADSGQLRPWDDGR